MPKSVELASLTLDLDDAPSERVIGACRWLASFGFSPIYYRLSASGEGYHVRANIASGLLPWSRERQLRVFLGDDPNRVMIDDARVRDGYPHGYLYDRKGAQRAGPWVRYKPS